MWSLSNLCADTSDNSESTHTELATFNSISAYTQTIKVNESIFLKRNKNTHKMFIAFLQTAYAAKSTSFVAKVLHLSVQKYNSFPYYHICFGHLTTSCWKTFYGGCAEFFLGDNEVNTDLVISQCNNSAR